MMKMRMGNGSSLSPIAGTSLDSVYPSYPLTGEARGFYAFQERCLENRETNNL